MPTAQHRIPDEGEIVTLSELGLALVIQDQDLRNYAEAIAKQRRVVAAAQQRLDALYAEQRKSLQRVEMLRAGITLYDRHNIL